MVLELELDLDRVLPLAWKVAAEQVALLNLMQDLAVNTLQTLVEKV